MNFTVYVDHKRYDNVKEIEIIKVSNKKRMPDKDWHDFQKLYKNVTGIIPTFTEIEVTLNFYDGGQFSFIPSRYGKNNQIIWFEREQKEGLENLLSNKEKVNE